MGLFLEALNKAKYDKKVDLGTHWEYWYKQPNGKYKKNKVKKSVKKKKGTVAVKEKEQKRKEETPEIVEISLEIDPQEMIKDRQKSDTLERFQDTPPKPKDITLPPSDFTIAHNPEQVFHILNNFNGTIEEGVELLYRSQRIKIDKIEGWDGTNAIVHVLVWNGRKYVKRPGGVMLLSELQGNVTPLSEVRLKKGTIVIAYIGNEQFMGSIEGSEGKKGIYQYYKVNIPDKGTMILRKDEILPVNTKQIVEKKNEIRDEEEAYAQEYQQKIIEEWKKIGYTEKDREAFWQKILAPVYMKLDSATSNFYKDIASKRAFYGVDDFFGEESFLLRALGIYEKALLNYVSKVDETGKKVPFLTVEKLNTLDNETMAKIRNGFLARFGGVYCRDEMDCEFKNFTIKSTGKKSQWLQNLKHLMIEKVGKVISYLPISRNLERVLQFIKDSEAKYQEINGRSPNSIEHFEFVWDELKNTEDKKIKSIFKSQSKTKEDAWYLFLALKTNANMKFENINDELMDENGEMLSREAIISEQEIPGRFKQTPQNLMEIKETAKNIRRIVDIVCKEGVKIGKKDLTGEQLAYAYKLITGIGEGGDNADEQFYFEKLSKIQQRDEFQKKHNIQLNNKDLEAIPAIFIERLNKQQNKLIAAKLKKELTEYAELNKAKKDQEDNMDKIAKLIRIIKRLHLRYLWDEMDS